MAVYNLIDEPWIDVVMPDGSCRSEGLRWVLLHAAEISDIHVQSFHGIRFSFYNYLVIRLLTGIIADAIPLDETNLRRMLRDGGFGDYAKPLEEYLDTYHERFNLFGSLPFLQAGELDRERWEKQGTNIVPSDGDIIKGNPLAPAESARIFEYSSVDTDQFLQVLDSPEPYNPLHSAIPKGLPSRDLQAALAECYAITPKEFAYILLYHNCMGPGVGSGNKAGIAGNAYYAETVLGDNLFETLLYNSAALAGGKNGGIPQWRWNSQLEYLTPGTEIEPLTGLFFPSRVIVSSLSGGHIADLAVATPRLSLTPLSIFDDIRRSWAERNEPHFVPVDPIPANAAMTNRYAKYDGHEPSWFLLLQATQTLPHIIPEPEGDGKKSRLVWLPLGRSSHNMAELARMGLLPENVRMRITYRVPTEKWGYISCSYVDGVFPSVLAVDQAKQDAVLRLAAVARNAMRQLDYITRVYLRPNPLAPEGDNNLFKGDCTVTGRLAGRLRRMLFGIDGFRELWSMHLGTHGFLDMVSAADEGDLDDTVSAFARAAAEEASDLFDSVYRPDRINLFYSCAWRLARNIGQEGGKTNGR